MFVFDVGSVVCGPAFCVALCESNPKCLSVSAHKETGDCHLSCITFSSKTGLLAQDPAWDYYFDPGECTLLTEITAVLTKFKPIPNKRDLLKPLSNSSKPQLRPIVSSRPQNSIWLYYSLYPDAWQLAFKAVAGVQDSVYSLWTGSDFTAWQDVTADDLTPCRHDVTTLQEPSGKPVGAGGSLESNC